jgi:GntR family transcriptional regulator
MHKPLHKTLTDKLRQMILSDDISVDDKLPTEPVLAKNLGVSRATLRESFKQIETEGLIYRVHGVGTFIKSKKPAITLNISIPRSITEMLNSLGLLPGTSFMSVKVETVFPDDMERLNLLPGSKVFRIERIRTANGQPVAYTIDTVPSWAMKKYPEQTPQSNFSLIEHLKYYCGIEMKESSSILMPLHNVISVAEKLEIDPLSHIFFFESLNTDQKGSTALFSKEYFSPWIFRFSILRKFE